MSTNPGDAGRTEATARWVGPPVVASTTDVEQLMKQAGKARKRDVEFTWVFERGEAESFRRYVLDGGVIVKGRYRYFAALVIDALNEALGEPRASHYLPRNPQTGSPEWRASGKRSGDRYVVEGRASFDLVFLYAYEATREEVSALAGGLGKMLKAAVVPLGWDLDELARRENRSVIMVLSGLPKKYGEEAELGDAAVLPELPLKLKFEGPFSLVRDGIVPCLFDDPIGNVSGVYLWTLPVGERRLPWYVGQTARSFVVRHGEHVKSYLSGEYPILDVDSLTEPPAPQDAWKTGRDSRPRDTGGAPADLFWPKTIPDFLANHAKHAEAACRLLRIARIHVAQVDTKVASLNRIEGALGRHFKRHNDEAIRRLFGVGIKLPSLFAGAPRLRIDIDGGGEISGLGREVVDPPSVAATSEPRVANAERKEAR